MSRIHIQWIRCSTYNAARKFRHVIYVHVWNDAPFYWRKADNFGVRYSPGYKHWIEGCLQHGGELYIGQISGAGEYSLDDVENLLIHNYGSKLNARIKEHKPLSLTYDGDLPPFIRRTVAPSPTR